MQRLDGIWKKTTSTLAYLFCVVFFGQHSPCHSIVSNQRNFCNLGFERNLRKKGFNFLIGSDESGRGSIAGPVVTASCCILVSNLDDFVPIDGVKDSKLLNSEKRLTIFNTVANRPDEYAFCTALRTNDNIDATNILQATMDSFKESIQGLISSCEFPFNECYSVVDGKNSPKLDYSYKGVVPCRPYVKADLEVYTVAIASIIARVTYDEIMREAHELYPQYNFTSNLGYSSPQHIQSIHKWGPSPLHR